MKLVFLAAASTSVLAVVLICVFLFAGGIPAIAEIGIFKFLFGTEWRPSNNIYGIFPYIIGSIYVTAGAILFGVPIALLTSVFMAKYCPKKLYPFFRSAINLMAGVPSIVYGFFGMVLIVPTIRNLFSKQQISGSSMLAASVLLGIMILPTVIGVTETSIRSVPQSYYEGSLALGATHERSVYCIVFPAAKSGILAGVVLGIGRAIGETMAVIMVAGNQPRMPQGILEGVRTMTANIVIEMGYAAGLHREALIATGVVLFVFILIINLAVSSLNRRAKNGN
ncbi:MAG: phosphate ABC transporter permease subunit PstC [Lachnospiraceae bacterium]|nr:phosphate ABC transporter permease subunit PstC [Lachnospiraceae bacterium]